MSDEIEMDAEEIADMTESNEQDLTPEDVFSLVMINKIRKKRVVVEVQDETGATIKLKDIVAELLNYIKAKSSESDDNQFMGQIIPLMSQAVASGLGRMIGIRQTAFYLS